MAAAALKDEYHLLQVEEGGGGHSMERRVGREAGGVDCIECSGNAVAGLLAGDSSGEEPRTRGPAMQGPVQYVTCHVEEFVLLLRKSVIFKSPATRDPTGRTVWFQVERLESCTLVSTFQKVLTTLCQPQHQSFPAMSFYSVTK